MELLMDNLKSALRRKGEPAGTASGEQKRRSGLKELSAMAAKVLGILAVSFIVARVSFFYVMYPCGLALLTVLMARGRGAIYVMAPILLGIVSVQGTSSLALGGVVTVLSCGVLFFALKNREISLTSRALIAAGISVVGKTGVCIALHTFYTYDGFSVLGEGLLVLFFVFVFEGALTLAEKENPTQSVAANIFILTVTSLLLVAGILPEKVDLLPQLIEGFSPVNAAALFLVLLTGYKLGVMEGAVSGVAAGLMLFGAANQGPAIMGILACGGMAAGLLRNEKRICAATLFCAVCLSFGFLKGYPALYMAVWEPVLASLILLLMPGRALEKADRILAKAGRDDAYYELLEKNRILSVLDEYRETFSYLALAYGPGKDGKRLEQKGGERGKVGKEQRSGRFAAAYQFTGMACAIDDMMKTLRHVEHPILIKEERFQVKTSVAGYARCQGISGDGTLCNHIRKGEYLLALSDGMGKGETAARESSLTLNTLLNLLKAGFEPELALRMINSLLLMKSTEEIFSTVDMGLINLYTGRLRLYKIGAATTFIKRGDKVEAVKASSLPLGMVEKISVDSIEVSLRKGDQIIIVSDGITEADRGKICTADLLNFRKEEAAAAGAENMRTVSASWKGTDAPAEKAVLTVEKGLSPAAKADFESPWGEKEQIAGRKTKDEDKIDFAAALKELEKQREEAERNERIKIRNLAGRRRAVESGRPATVPGRAEGKNRYEDWLKDTIAEIRSSDPQTISDLILNRAVERCGLKERDDMTVITACIE